MKNKINSNEIQRRVLGIINDYLFSYSFNPIDIRHRYEDLYGIIPWYEVHRVNYAISVLYKMGILKATGKSKQKPNYTFASKNIKEQKPFIGIDYIPFNIKLS